MSDKYGLTLVFNDEIRASKPKRERDDWDNLLTHRNGRALGAVVLEGQYTAKADQETGLWISFFKDGVEIDDADTFDVIDVINGYFYIEGDKNIYIIEQQQAVALGFEHESVTTLIEKIYKPGNTLEAELTGYQSDVML